MNRLADYLYILARYTDAKMEEMSAEEVDKPTEKTSDGGKDESEPCQRTRIRQEQSMKL